MLATQETIECLAERIERAYMLRRPQWNPGCSTSRVWETAVSVLVGVHREDPTIPLDPELFVAAQQGVLDYADPWSELAQPRAGRRFRKRVRQIVEGLREELGREVRRGERQVQRGKAIERVVLAGSRSLSALGCYIIAHRAGRDDLAERLRRDAVKQHRSCPLYRQACLTLLPVEVYPEQNPQADGCPPPPLRRPRTQVHLN